MVGRAQTAVSLTYLRRLLESDRTSISLVYFLPPHVNMKGLMQDSPLVVTNILDYAAKWHGEQVNKIFIVESCNFLC